MIRTTPWRRTILHFSQRFLTEAWTFICLPETISNPAPGQVIGGQFHQYLVSREDPNKVHPDFAGCMGQNSVPISQFYTKHRVWQVFFYGAFNLNRLFFRHSAGSFHHLPDSVIQKRHFTERGALGQWRGARRDQAEAAHRPLEEGRLRTTPARSAGWRASRALRCCPGAPRPRSRKDELDICVHRRIGAIAEPLQLGNLVDFESNPATRVLV